MPVSRAGLPLGAWGLLSAILVVTRVFESLFGRDVAYPTANAAAIVIVVMATTACSMMIRSR